MSKAKKLGSKEFGFATNAIHAGQEPDATYGAIMTPVYQTSTFVQKSPGVYPGRYDYSRSGNPTRTAFDANVAALEQGKYGISFSSGLAAISAIVHLLEAGDHVVLNDDVYGGTFRLFDKIYKKFGISYTMVDMANMDAVDAAFTPKTKLVMLESPTNPLLKVIDLQAVTALARNRNALSAVDNTFASPFLQNPLTLGADIVVHSTTKYIGGHSDVIGGVVVVNDDELNDRLLFVQLCVGAVPAPWESFMLMRSTKTLHLRMERHCENAMKVAQFLDSHSDVEHVYYPGLPSHPQHELAKKQMKGFGGIVAMTMRGDLNRTKSFLEKTELFSLAESLGGVESLIEHPAIMTHASIPKESREELGIVDGFVRLSVGVEDAEDLIEDLGRALDLSA